MAVIAVLAALLYPVFSQARERARRATARPGPAVTDAQFGVRYAMPPLFPPPRRNEERQTESGSTYRMVTFSSEGAPNGEDASIVQVHYYPGGLNAETSAAKQVAESTQTIVKSLGGTGVMQRPLTISGKPALDSRFSARMKSSGVVIHYRLLSVVTQDRLILMWFGTPRTRPLDDAPLNAYFNSLQITQVGKSLSSAH